MRLPATAAFACLALVAAPARASAPPYPEYPAYPPAAPAAPDYPPWPHYPRAPRAPLPPDAPFPPDAPSPPPRSPPPPRPPHHPHPPPAPPSPPPPRPPPAAPPPPPPPPPPPAPADPAVAFVFVAAAGFVVVAAAWVAHFAGSDVDVVDHFRGWIERNDPRPTRVEDDEEAAGAYAELRNVEGETMTGDDDGDGFGRRRESRVGGRGWIESAVDVVSRALAGVARGFASAGSDAFDDGGDERFPDEGIGAREGNRGDVDGDVDVGRGTRERPRAKELVDGDAIPAPRHHLRGPARGKSSARWSARRAVDPNAAYEPLREDVGVATDSGARAKGLPSWAGVSGSSSGADAESRADAELRADAYADRTYDAYADRTYDDDYAAESDASGRSGASARSPRRSDRGGAATMRFYGASAAKARAATEAAANARRGGPDATEWRDDDP